MRALEGLVFLSVATALHVGAWHLAPFSDGSTAAGSGGNDSATLAAASASQAAMVARWQEPIVSSPGAPVAPVAPSSLSAPSAPVAEAPALRASAKAPTLSPPTPPLTQTPRIKTQPAALPDRQSTTPATRPKARTASVSARAQNTKQAAGAGRAAQRGQTKSQEIQSANSARTHALKAQWGASIHAKVQRSMRYPRTMSTAGTAKLALEVARDGRLRTLKLMRSSGNTVLDAAALRAVQRAGRFAAAPDGLTADAYAFSVSLTFKR